MALDRRKTIAGLSRRASQARATVQPVAAGVRRLTRLIVPENVNSGRSPDFRMPRRKIIEPPARVTSPEPSTSSPSRAA